MANFFVLKSFKCDTDEILRKRHLESGGKVQQHIDRACLRYCEPLVPKDTGMLIQSGIDHTIIGNGEVRYEEPYARRWYFKPANFQQGSGSGMESIGRGNYWFERMKSQYKGKILEGAKKIANGG